ncbi:MAG: BRCT domain-containing protein [Planctomycetota bacterium]
MMRSSSRQGGAVNILFFVGALVIALVGWGLWFSEYKGHEEAVKNEVVAKDDLLESQGKLTEYKRGIDSITKVLGLSEFPEPTGLDDEGNSAWIDTTVAPAVGIVRKVVDEGRALSGGGESVTTITQLLDPIQAKLDAQGQEITRLKRDLSAARNATTSAEQANDTLIEQQAVSIQAKESELTDNKDRAATQLKQSDDNLVVAQGQITSLTESLETRLTETQAAMQKMEEKTNTLDREVRQVKGALRHETVSAEPDGKVMSVDQRAGMCWIDIGSNKQLRGGTRFRSYGVLKGGVREYHGFVVVKKIEARRALCAVEHGATTQNGDFITNPYYDSEGQHTFYFLGNLPGRFDNQRSAAILRDFGATVADKFSPSVDFLVLGNNPDPEADLGEDADVNWFQATEAYTNATRWNIEVLLARDLEDFLKF